MDDNDDYEFVPIPPSNVTIPFENNNVFTDAFSIVLGGLALVAIVPHLHPFTPGNFCTGHESTRR
jgi:hypothetical protein